MIGPNHPKTHSHPWLHLGEMTQLETATFAPLGRSSDVVEDGVLEAWPCNILREFVRLPSS